MDALIQHLLKRLTPAWEMIWFFYQRFASYHRISSWFDMASGTTYYFLLGFIPFLIFLVNIMLFLMSPQVDSLYGAVGRYLPERMAGPIMADIARVVASRSTLWMWVSGLVSMYSFVQGLEILTRATDSLDYARTEELARDTRHNVLIHVKGVLFTLGLMVVIIVCLGLPVFGNTVVQYMDQNSDLPTAFMTIWNLLCYILPFAVVVIWLALFYIFAPHSYTPSFRQAGLTALAVTCVWLGVTAVYSWCMLLIPNMGLAYGSLFGLFALFIWFKFIATAIIYGIEFMMALTEIELRHKIEKLQKN